MAVIGDSTRVRLGLIVSTISVFGAVGSAAVAYAVTTATIQTRVESLEGRIDRQGKFTTDLQSSLVTKVDRLTEVVMRMDGALQEMQRQDSNRRR